MTRARGLESLTQRRGVAVEDLSFRYSARQPHVISGLSLELPTGGVAALTGVSGSGKSTLLYLLALLLRPSSGAVLWDGERVGGLSDGARASLRASRSGFVFQDAALDPARTVLDNVCEPALFAGMPRREAVARAEELLERFGVAHRARHRPGEVSGGQAQRVALCRALLTRPSFVFGDEPTGNLDRVSAEVVWAGLEECARAGATVIVATHDDGLANRADVRVHLS